MAAATSFADQVAASFPSGMTLPDEFRRLLLWMEDNGFVHRYRSRDARYASLFPADIEPNSRSSIAITPVDAAQARDWAGIDDAAGARLAPFIRTGGDGSYAALWRDDDGRQRFVHMGSGSGSVMMCVLCNSAVDMLRLMAVGYDELCWPDQHAMTPEDVADDDVPASCDTDERPDFIPPRAFRSWVETTFGVTVPKTASGIVKRTASMDDASSDDAFWRWIKSVQR